MPTVTLPYAPLTANARLRSHWSAGHRDRKRFLSGILAELGRGPWWHRTTRSKGRVMEVSITVGRKRLQDLDNAWSSAKGAIDALRKAGWCFDDSPKWIKLHVAEVKAKVPYTEISVYEE